MLSVGVQIGEVPAVQASPGDVVPTLLQSTNDAYGVSSAFFIIGFDGDRLDINPDDITIPVAGWNSTFNVMYDDPDYGDAVLVSIYRTTGLGHGTTVFAEFPFEVLSSADPGLAEFNIFVSDFNEGNIVADPIVNGGIEVVVATNSPPVVDLNGGGAGVDYAASFTEDGAAAAIADATATVTDADAGDTTLASLTMTVGSNPDGAAEVITVGGTAFPLNADLTATGTGGATTFSVAYVSSTRTFTATKSGGGEAPIGNIQTLLRGVTYHNTSQNPTGGTRTISVVANDGTDNSAAGVSTITVNPENDAPGLAGTSAITYIENDPATAINAGITVSDVDNTTLASGTVTITNFVAGQDVLGFVAVPGTMGNIAGSVTDGVLTLTSAGAAATLAQWEAALHAVTYANSSDNPATTQRSVTFVVNDGGTGSNTITSTIDITAVNDAPGLAGTSTITYVENDPATTINTSITVSDVDSATLANGTVTITNYVAGQDVLGFVAVPGTMGNIAGTVTNGVLSLTSAGAAATLAQWQAALHAVTYANSSDNPTTTPRSVTFQVDDGAAANHASNVITSVINITAVNDPPTDIVWLDDNLVNQSTDDEAIVGNLGVTGDPDGNPVVFFTMVAGAGGTNNNLFTVNGNNRVETAVNVSTLPAGTYYIRVQADDQNGGFFEKALEVIVVDDIDPTPPTDANPDSNTAAEGAPAGTLVGITAASTNPPQTPDTITYSLTVNPGGRFQIDPASGIVTVASGVALDYESSAPTHEYSITVRATDGGLNFAEDVFTITVTNVAPTAQDDLFTTDEETDASGNVLSDNGNGADSDPNGATLTVTEVNGVGTNVGLVVPGDGGGNFRIFSSGAVTFMPGSAFQDLLPGQSRSTKVEYTLSDGTASDTATVTVTVNGVNDDPTAVDDTATVDEDSGANAIDVLANDLMAPDAGETLLISGVTQGAHGTVAITGGGTGLTYTPAADYFGPDSFTYTIGDGNGGTSTASVSVTVELPPTMTLTGDDATPEAATYTLTLGLVVYPGVPADVLSYVINWGDGVIGRIAASALPPSRQVSHVYVDGLVPQGTAAPTHVITVDVLDTEDYRDSVGSKEIVVYNLAPSASFGGNSMVNEGAAALVMFYGQTDPSSQDRAAGYTYRYDFDNDSIFDTAMTTDPSATVPAAYLTDGPSDLTVRGRIFDKDGGYADYTRVIHVNNVAPAVNAGADSTVGADEAFTLYGTFADPGADTWTATIDWDWHATDTDAVPLPLSGKTFAAPHVFETSGSYVVAVTVTDDDGDGHSDFVNVTVEDTPLRVTSLTPTVSGFDVTFNRAVDMSKVNLYDGWNEAAGTNSNYGSPDLSLKLGATTIRGSVVWDAASNTAHFVKTGGIKTDNTVTGALNPGVYTVTLFSRIGDASDPGWTGVDGELLDGDGNGVAGGNFVQTFAVASDSSPMLSIPDFARGPGLVVNVLRDGTAGHTGNIASGVPITISDSDGVLSFAFELDYNPDFLTISGAAAGADLAGWAFFYNNDPVTGQLFVGASGSEPLPAGTRSLVVLSAAVPANSSSTPYGAAEVLQVKDARLNEGNLPVRADDAVHKLVHLGDGTGNGGLSSQDVSLLSRIQVRLDSGFYASRLTDPVIIGDASGDGSVGSYDGSLVSQKVVLKPVPELPTRGGPVTVVGPDPTVQVGDRETFAKTGEAVPTRVRVTDNAFGLSSAVLTITYDTTRLDLATDGVTLSTYLSDRGWSLARNVDDAAGVIYVSLASPTRLPAGTPDLLNLAFRIPAGAPLGTSPLVISGYLNEGGLTMTSVNGSITVVGVGFGAAEGEGEGASAGSDVTDAQFAAGSDVATADAALAELFLVPSLADADEEDDWVAAGRKAAEEDGNAPWDVALLSLVDGDA